MQAKKELEPVPSLDVIISSLKYKFPPFEYKYGEGKTFDSFDLICKHHLDDVCTFRNELLQELISIMSNSFRFPLNLYKNASYITIIHEIMKSDDVHLSDANVSKLLDNAGADGLYIIEEYIKSNHLFTEGATSLCIYRWCPKMNDLLKLYPCAFRYTAYTLSLAIQYNVVNFIYACLSDNKLKLSEDNLLHICEVGNIELIKFCATNGMMLSIEALEHACSSGKKDAIEYIASKKITPTKKCFENVMTSMKNNRSDCIDILRAYGYVITYEDVLLAIKKQVTIHNLDTLGIKLNKKYAIACELNNFYPLGENVAQCIQSLEVACSRSGNLKRIRELVCKNKLVPNMKCLTNACGLRSNVATINFIMQRGNIHPDLECIHRAVSSGSLCVIRRVIDAYIEGKTSKEEYMKIHKINKVYKVYDSDVEDDKDNKVIPQEKKHTKKVGAKKANTKKVINVVDSDNECQVVYCDFTDEPKTEGNKNNDDNLLTSVPDNFDFKKTIDLGSKFRRLFNVKPKTTSFLDAKKLLTKYIISNNLLNDGNIVLDDLMKDAMMNKNINTVSMQNIENLVYTIIGN